MTTADKPLFNETDDIPLAEASLDDVVRRIAAQSDLVEEQSKHDPDGDYSLVEVEPKDNGHTLITLQDNDGNILVEDGLQNINWNALDDNTFQTYQDFLKQAAEDPSTGGDAHDTILPIRSKTTGGSSSSTPKTTHFTNIAQRYIQENQDAVLAELLEGEAAEVHVADDLHDEYRIEAFNNKRRLSQIRSHIESHAPDLSPERSTELREAAMAYREAVGDAIDGTTIDTSRAYFSEQFTHDKDSRRKKKIGSLAHDIIHWQLKNLDDFSAKAFTSAVKDTTYEEDYDEMSEETGLFLRGSDDWLLYGAAHDFFEANDALLDQYRATKSAVSGTDPAAHNKIADAAAMIEFPSQNHGSRQILKQLNRRNWVHDEYESREQGSIDDTYAFEGPTQSTIQWHFNQSVLNHVLNREQRYMDAIGTDIIEQEAARLGNSYTSEDLVEASYRAITDGVPDESDRRDIFTNVRTGEPLEDPEESDKSYDQVYLARDVGAQLLANATIRAHAEGHNVDDPLRTYNN